MKSCLRKVMHAQGPSHMVCFSQIEICEFPEELGDNPTTLTGVPIGLGKKLEHRVVYDVEWYESFRERRRTRDELRIPPNLRFQS